MKICNVKPFFYNKLRHNKTKHKDEFRKLSVKNLRQMGNPNPVLIDVRRTFNAEEAIKEGFIYRAL